MPSLSKNSAKPPRKRLKSSILATKTHILSVYIFIVALALAPKELAGSSCAQLSLASSKGAKNSSIYAMPYGIASYVQGVGGRVKQLLDTGFARSSEG